jgi:hypothetical protein
VGAALIRHLTELLPVESQPLLEQRYARYRKFGRAAGADSWK